MKRRRQSTEHSQYFYEVLLDTIRLIAPLAPSLRSPAVAIPLSINCLCRPSYKYDEQPNHAKFSMCAVAWYRSVFGPIVVRQTEKTSK